MSRPGARTFVIAEAGVNHDGSLAKALALVDAAREAGADAVKFQTFRPEALVSARAEKARYQKARGGKGERQKEMLARLVLDPKAHQKLRDRAVRRGIEFMSTPFDTDSARMLVELGMRRIKIGSGEVTNHPFLAALGGLGLPVILSTGMADLVEVGAALAVLEGAGCREIALLQCVTEYPAPVEAANLRAMATLAAAFGRPVGYSDHTLGSEACLAAVALGATILEKHMTLDRHAPGPDHAASMEPGELCNLVASVRRVEAALGDGVKRIQPCEVGNRAVARRSLVALRRLAAGEVIGPGAVAALRPATGIAPAHLETVLGMRLARAVDEGVPLRWEDFKP